MVDASAGGRPVCVRRWWLRASCFVVGKGPSSWVPVWGVAIIKKVVFLEQTKL